MSMYMVVIPFSYRHDAEKTLKEITDTMRLLGSVIAVPVGTDYTDLSKAVENKDADNE